MNSCTLPHGSHTKRTRLHASPMIPSGDYSRPSRTTAPRTRRVSLISVRRWSPLSAYCGTSANWHSDQQLSATKRTYSNSGTVTQLLPVANRRSWRWSSPVYCRLLLGGRYRGGADLHLFVDGLDNGGPSSAHFFVEARLQRLTDGPNQCRTHCVIVLFLHSVTHVALSQFAQHGDDLLPIVDALHEGVERGNQLFR